MTRSSVPVIMLNNRSKIGIAEIVFYAPAIILAGYLLSHRRDRPRMTWIVLFIYTNGQSSVSVL